MSSSSVQWIPYNLMRLGVRPLCQVCKFNHISGSYFHVCQCNPNCFHGELTNYSCPRGQDSYFTKKIHRNHPCCFFWSTALQVNFLQIDHPSHPMYPWSLKPNISAIHSLNRKKTIEVPSKSFRDSSFRVNVLQKVSSTSYDILGPSNQTSL